MKQIITVRHTEALHQQNGMVGSWTDWPLTDHGAAQAEALARRLSPLLAGQSCLVYTSDLTRAVDTARPLCAALGVPLCVTPVLRERRLGRACGQSESWLAENADRAGPPADSRPFPEAESRRDVWRRLQPLYRRLLHSPADIAVLVSHADTLGIFNALWLGLLPHTLSHGETLCPPGGVTFLAKDDEGRHVILRMGDLSFLEG